LNIYPFNLKKQKKIIKKRKFYFKMQTQIDPPKPMNSTSFDQKSKPTGLIIPPAEIRSSTQYNSLKFNLFF